MGGGIHLFQTDGVHKIEFNISSMACKEKNLVFKWRCTQNSGQHNQNGKGEETHQDLHWSCS